MKRAFVLLLFACICVKGLSQNYHAMQGSSYAGSLGVDNNPASIVNTPSPWDINLFSFQLKYATNAVTVLNYSLLGSPAESKYRINSGDYSRFGTMNFNLHLVNARIALKRKQAVAFGINLKTYSEVRASRYNITDTIKGINDFLIANQNNPYMHARVRSSSWIEIFGTYSRTLKETYAGRLNGGITLKAMRGVSGAFMDFRNASFRRAVSNTNRPEFRIQSASLAYGYSANYDKWTKERSGMQNFKDMLVSSEGGLSADLGLEYLVKEQGISSSTDDDNYYDYNWKIGFSLLDLGKNNFKPGRESRTINDPDIGINALAFEQKFRKIPNFKALNDTLATVIDGINRLPGIFSVTNPARMVLNVDHWMGGNFYMNGELSVNLSAVPGIDKLHVSEMNFLTLTPRWETRRYGLYLPMAYNTEKKFWMGAGFKIGPVIGGIHNLGNVFSKNKMQNGGGYLAIIIKPSSITRGARDGRNDCPPINK